MNIDQSNSFLYLKTLAIHLDTTYWFPVYILYFLLSLSCRPSSRKGWRQWRGRGEWILWCLWGRSRVYHCTSRPQISQVCIYCLAPVVYSHPSLSLNSLLIWVLLDLSVCILCLPFPFLLSLTLWLSHTLFPFLSGDPAAMSAESVASWEWTTGRHR